MSKLFHIVYWRTGTRSARRLFDTPLPYKTAVHFVELFSGGDYEYRIMEAK